MHTPISIPPLFSLSLPLYFSSPNLHPTSLPNSVARQDVSAQRLEVEKLKAQMIKHGVTAKQPTFASSVDVADIENMDVNIRPPLATLGTAEKDPKKRTMDRAEAPGTMSTVEMR